MGDFLEAVAQALGIPICEGSPFGREKPTEKLRDEVMQRIGVLLYLERRDRERILKEQGYDFNEPC